MVILHALKKWRPYLIGRNFKVKINHDSHKYFLEHRVSSEEQQKWITKMLGYDFEISIKKGNKMWWKMHSPKKMRMLRHYFL